MNLRDLWQEAYELGPRGALHRAGWELQMRADLWHQIAALLDRGRPKLAHDHASNGGLGWTTRLPFADAHVVAHAMRPRMAPGALAELRQHAQSAVHGRIRCFGTVTTDFGRPIDWHLHPSSQQRWQAKAPWWRSLDPAQHIGDVKLTWEVARFPHAYHMARAAAFEPECSEAWATALLTQMQGFNAQNPVGRGVHWLSGQEIAVRLLAWVFALDTLLCASSVGAAATRVVGHALAVGALHVERHIHYAHHSVYNNHLLAEALALLLAGVLLRHGPDAARWRKLGLALLSEGAERQVYRDGAYIQQSHNYHRVALQYYLWACALARAGQHDIPEAWTRALSRSVDFLVAQQNPSDGHLPNFGSNDGAMPSILSTCAYADFRPVLQAASLQCRGERLYPPGPWDESAAWFLGPLRLGAPLRPPRRTSVSFATSGYHVLRGRQAHSFALLRCGNVRERFTQIDMLHADIWWRGHNLLVDGGSYLYNGPARWHQHFACTGSHNTLTIDDRDQMLHLRRFKNVYRTQARLLHFETAGAAQVCTGEHHGYRRHRGGCVHRRSILMWHSDLWVVCDTVLGRGEHTARLHWLAGNFSHTFDGHRLRLTIAHGDADIPVDISVYDAAANLLPGTVARGQKWPPRGWQARHYSVKTPVPSLAVESRGAERLQFISIIGPGNPELSLLGRTYRVHQANGPPLRFRITRGHLVAEPDQEQEGPG